MKKIKNNFSLREAVVKVLGNDEINLFDVQAINDNLVDKGETPSTNSIRIKNKFDTWYLRTRQSKIEVELEDDLGTTQEQFRELVASGEIKIESSLIQYIGVDGTYLQYVGNPDAEYGYNLNGNRILNNYGDSNWSDLVVIVVTWTKYDTSDSFTFSIPPYDLELELDPTFGRADYSRIKLHEKVYFLDYFQFRGYVKPNGGDVTQLTNWSGGGDWLVYPYIRDGYINMRINGANPVTEEVPNVDGEWDYYSGGRTYEDKYYAFTPRTTDPIELSIGWANGQTEPYTFTIEVYTRVISWSNEFDYYPVTEIENRNDLIELTFKDDWDEGTDYAELLDNGDAVLSTDSEYFEIVDKRYIRIKEDVEFKEEIEVSITIEYPYYQTSSTFTFKMYPIDTEIEVTTNFDNWYLLDYLPEVAYRTLSFNSVYDILSLIDISITGGIELDGDTLKPTAENSAFTITINWKLSEFKTTITGTTLGQYQYKEYCYALDEALERISSDGYIGNTYTGSISSFSNLEAYGIGLHEMNSSYASVYSLIDSAFQKEIEEESIVVNGINLIKHLPVGASVYRSINYLSSTGSVQCYDGYRDSKSSGYASYFKTGHCIAYQTIQYTTDGKTWQNWEGDTQDICPLVYLYSNSSSNLYVGVILGVRSSSSTYALAAYCTGSNFNDGVRERDGKRTCNPVWIMQRIKASVEEGGINEGKTIYGYRILSIYLETDENYHVLPLEEADAIIFREFCTGGAFEYELDEDGNLIPNDDFKAIGDSKDGGGYTSTSSTYIGYVNNVLNAIKSDGNLAILTYPETDTTSLKSKKKRTSISIDTELTPIEEPLQNVLKEEKK